MQSIVNLSSNLHKQVAEYFTYHSDLQDAIICLTPQETVSRLEALYKEHSEDLQKEFLKPESIEKILTCQRGTYPYLGVYVETTSPDSDRSYGSVTKPGFYGCTLTQPGLFSAYLLEQLEALYATHKAVFIIGQSRRLIPISFLQENILSSIRDFSHLKPLLVLPSLNDIDDNIANGLANWDELPVKPLSFFSAERMDYSLGRIKHYCGTSVQHFQNFVLLTNYQRYVDGFFQYAKEGLESGEYTSWVEPQDHIINADNLSESHHREIGHGFQMPAYHLKREDKSGITLINIGVGPSNTKTITDHLAVLRPHCWLMIGHCGGLNHTQRLGDYVMANGYMRDDRILDEELPLNIPIPPVAEVQQAITQSLITEMDVGDAEIRRCFRSGTVVSTGNRNWELRVKELSPMLNLSRAVAVDMESATLAANAFRFCVPYGALLCISDRPLHGELKLHGQARVFYQQRVQQHLRIGIKTMELLRSKCLVSLHSRKLRGFQSIPFR